MKIATTNLEEYITDKTTEMASLASRLKIAVHGNKCTLENDNLRRYEFVCKLDTLIEKMNIGRSVNDIKLTAMGLDALLDEMYVSEKDLEAEIQQEFNKQTSIVAKRFMCNLLNDQKAILKLIIELKDTNKLIVVEIEKNSIDLAKQV